MITLQDKELLAKKGISEEQIAEQLACFEKGFPYLKLSAAASVEQGILAPDADEQKKYLNAWEAYTQTDKTVVKFVPASGAESVGRKRVEPVGLAFRPILYVEQFFGLVYVRQDGGIDLCHGIARQHFADIAVQFQRDAFGGCRITMCVRGCVEVHQNEVHVSA